MTARSGFVMIIALVLFGVVSAVASSGPAIEQSNDSLEYAQLIVQGDAAIEGPQSVRVIWNEGDRILTPNYVTIDSLNRLLSRRALRPTMANLLNSIGANGWELVTISKSSSTVMTWTFRREL